MSESNSSQPTSVYRIGGIIMYVPYASVGSRSTWTQIASLNGEHVADAT